MSIKKTSIQQALIEAREIEKSAIDKARKALEEELAPKIRQVATDALRELEQEAINEDVTIRISTDGGEEIETPEMNSDGIETPETLGDENEIADDGIPSDENDNIDNLDEMDIFEIDGLGEAEEIAQPEGGAAPAEMPAPEGTEAPAPEGAEAMAPEETATIETVNQKLDDVLAKLEAISSEETAEHGEGESEGDVEIVDDQPEAEAPVGPPAPAPTPALQEDDELYEYELDDDNEEEVVYEYEDGSMEEEVMFELEDDNDDLGINEISDLTELEIVDEDDDEDDDEDVSEMLGVGLNLKHSSLGKLPNKGVNENKKINESINKIKAQYGSKNDELSKENESLKQTIKEYKESFVVLRKQINEVQIFNAKLAYANKLFTNGGLTNDEKIKIAEDFDSVQTIEEAKKLYNTFLSEMKISKSSKPTSIDKLKSASPAVVNSSNAQTLFESDEMRRMKRLAGIGKKIEE